MNIIYNMYMYVYIYVYIYMYIYIYKWELAIEMFDVRYHQQTRWTYKIAIPLILQMIVLL